MTTVRLKLLIDTKQKKVLFAEAGKDFVDFLFALLSFPAGTIIRLLSKDSMVGSLGKLYDSFENFSATFMQPNLNKDILLKPKEPGAVPNNLGLLTNVEKSERKAIYICYYHSYSTPQPYYSDDPKAKCPTCGHNLSCAMTYVAHPLTSTPVKASSTPKEIGFVKPLVAYMIMDDLEVKPMSTISPIALLNRFNVRDFGALEEKVVELGMDEGVKLLKESLQSKSVLTNVFLGGVSGRVKHEDLNAAIKIRLINDSAERQSQESEKKIHKIFFRSSKHNLLSFDALDRSGA